MKRLSKWLIRLSSVLFLVLLSGCECEQPEIISINPNSGPGGTIVEVQYSKGGLGGVVLLDGTTQETRYASNLGLGKTLYFTIPFNAATGNKNVQVRSDGKTSPAVTFNVTGSGVVPTPTINGVEIPNRDGKEITVFGRNFSTLSKVFIDGVEVKRYAGHSLPLRVLPLQFVDNAIICEPQTPLALGSSHTIEVRNPNNNNSGGFAFDVPDRVCMMEFDALQNIPLPQYYIFRNNSLTTMRKEYTECGWILEITYDDTSVADPQAGSPFTTADMFSFWQANANVPSSAEIFMHGAFLTADNQGLLGIMFMNVGSVPSLPNANRRQGFAVFRNAFSPPNLEQFYLRTTMHEAGHGFNLLHSDGDGIQSIMNQTSVVGNNFVYDFSNISCEHLESHDIDAVAPGGEAFGSGRSCNNLH